MSGRAAESTQESASVEPRRILSLDGGGIKGVLPAAFLAQIEHLTGKRILDYFDLIVGTSTGGIIALGLGLGLPAQEVLNFYRENGPTIFGAKQPATRLRFGAGGRAWRGLRRLIRPRYSAAPLRSALEAAFGKRKLGDCSTRLVIPAFNPSQRSVYVFKTAHDPRFMTDWRESAVDVALATGAAPTYFPQHELAQGTGLVDGGVWANNPVGLAVVEALGVLDWRRDSLHVLSLGCSEAPIQIPTNAGILRLALKSTELFMMGQSHGSLGTAKLLLRDREQLLRVQHVAEVGEFALDTVDQIDKLRGLGASLARDQVSRIEEQFLNTTRQEFEPYHGGGSQ